MESLKNNSTEIKLTDYAGAETLLQVRLPFVAVDGEDIYKFTDTHAGIISGRIIAALVESEEHFIDKETIVNIYGQERNASLTRTARNINRLVKPISGYDPFEVIKDGTSSFGFAGLKIHDVEPARAPKVLSIPSNEDTIITPLDNRLQKSGVDIEGMTLVEKRIVDSLRSRAGVHLNIESITELLLSDYNVRVDKQYVVRTLTNLLNRNRAGRLPKIQFRVINGDLRVQWELAKVLESETKDFNQRQSTIEGVSMVPLKWKM
jgi:hypothetical protein